MSSFFFMTYKNNLQFLSLRDNNFQVYVTDVLSMYEKFGYNCWHDKKFYLNQVFSIDSILLFPKKQQKKDSANMAYNI